MKTDLVARSCMVCVLSCFMTTVFGSVLGFRESIEYKNDISRKNLKTLPEIFSRKVAHYYPSSVERKEDNNDKYEYYGVNISDQNRPIDSRIESGSGTYNTRQDGLGGGNNYEDSEYKEIGHKIALAVVGIVAIAVVGGLLLIPLVFIPLGIVTFIGYNLPLVKILEIPDSNNDDMVGIFPGEMGRFSDESSCIERISCQIGRKSGTPMKIILHWILSNLSDNKMIQRISRGFDEEKDCALLRCSLPILRRIS